MALALYDLIGVVSHVGSMDSGHYYAHCRDASKQWFRIDDEEVYEENIKDIGFDREGSEFAYLLFYSRRDNK